VTPTDENTIPKASTLWLVAPPTSLQVELNPDTKKSGRHPLHRVFHKKSDRQIPFGVNL